MLCKCGCGQKIMFNKYKLIKYINGHNSRINNNFLKRKKSWNKDLTKKSDLRIKQLAENISKTTIKKGSHKGKNNGMYNKHHSKKSIKKMSIKAIGREYSEERNKKISLKIKGENNGMWVGGLAKLLYPRGFTYELKEYIRKRDGHKCQLCGMPEIENGRKLDVHHIDYNKKNLSEVNLLSLCKGDNCIVNKNRKFWTEYFTRLMISRIDLKTITLK